MLGTPTARAQRWQARACAAAGHPLAERRHRRARAYRHGELLCGGVYVTVRADTRLGIAPRERRDIAAYFLEHLAPPFRHELAQLVHRRGAAAQRVAESLEPIELVFDDPHHGTQRIVGRVVPPQVRRGELQEIQFGLRELRLSAVSDAG